MRQVRVKGEGSVFTEDLSKEIYRQMSDVTWETSDATPISFGSYSTYIVGCRGASQLGGSLLGIPPGYKANKL